MIHRLSKKLFAISLITFALLSALLGTSFLFSERKPSALFADSEVQLSTTGNRILPSTLDDAEISLFLAGDTIITKPWSADRDPNFMKLVGEIRAADAAIINLETLIHDYKGYPQANSGGTYMASPPEIASELSWAGIDMVANANNHAFDYGSIGILENMSYLKQSGLVVAGIGKDLQDARAPQYFKTKNGKVGLLAAASTFVYYGKASRSRPDMYGRPGVNPLTRTSQLTVTVKPSTAAFLRNIAKALGYEGNRFVQHRFKIWKLQFRVGDAHRVETGPRVARKDLKGNLLSLKEAVASSDLVVVSIHAHDQEEWLTDLAHSAIDLGADVFFCHGPHEIRGIEIYKGRPIFYSMGNFVFQLELIERLPSEYYDKFGLGDQATAHDIQKARSALDLGDYAAKRKPWEAFAAIIRFQDSNVKEIRLLPLDLGFGKPLPLRGKPRYADSQLGKYIVECIAEKSRRYGTVITYDAEANAGIVTLPVF